MTQQYRVKAVESSGYVDIAVSDGFWVVQTFSYSRTEYLNNGDENGYGEDIEHTAQHNMIVGPEPTATVLDKGNGLSTVSSSWFIKKLLVGSEPFGVITTDTDEGIGSWFTSARQIHKGELGRRPQIKRPQIVRQSFDSPDARRVRDRRRGKHGWVNLAELADIAGLPVPELVLRYFAFTDARCPRLEVVIGDAQNVREQPLNRYKLQQIRLGDLTPEYWRTQDPTVLWVRSGWALAVLYMRNLGYTPDPYLPA